MHIHIESFDLHRVDLQTRMPFRYGIAAMTHMPEVFLRLHVRVDGREAVGISSDCLPPKWFTKIPAKPVAEEIQEMIAVIKNAAALALGLSGGSPFAVWRQLYEAQFHWGQARRLPPLLTNFGTSLVERALIEAVGRATDRTFAEMLRANTLGLQLGEVHKSLSGAFPADLLPATALPRIVARHTVGLADPITDSDIASTDRLDDGLPQSLAACIKTYGLSHFKIKVNGDLSRDLDRLSRMSEVLQRSAPADFAFSLDGNEQFKSMEEFRDFWEALVKRPNLREFLERLLFVEQPLHRDVALQPAVAAALQSWPGRPTFIIDESDGALEDSPTALQLGYAGTSHKNCKGIFKGIAHRCLLLQRQRERPGEPALMSGEDLCNIGPVALLQDLAVMATLGIQSVERNGHHYHAGLSQFPEQVQQKILLHHPDLYLRSHQGWPTLRIVNGQIQLDTINRAPFGVGFQLDVAPFELIE